MVSDEILNICNQSLIQTKFVLVLTQSFSVFMYTLGDEIEHVNTICLPFDYVDGRTWAGKSLVVAGWGYTQSSAFFGSMLK